MNGDETSCLLTLGHGYSAAALARRLIPHGWHVIGSTRRDEKATMLEAEGVEPLRWPGDDAAAHTAIIRASHVLISASPEPTADGGGVDPVLAGLGDALRARGGGQGAGIRWIGYLSTTGVYGDRAGAWVDETSTLETASPRGLARVAAERDWIAFGAETGIAVQIFRLAGIYGPGRGPFAKIKAGTARRIIKPGQVFSRIHVEDIAAVLEASIAEPNPGAIYNVCDDEPAPPEDVLGHAASLLGLPPPPEVAFDDAEMTPMARSFYMESRRVSNRRLRDELGVTLSFPTYREGLAADLATERKAEA
ncbi:MAG: SDR family oxidoreductase [Pseudomonadota bacterium]